MNFCGSVGKLMIDCGLTEILKHAFGGIEKCYLAKNTHKMSVHLGFLLRSY